jgi:GNAT superfamily N-acetyltransferase
MDGCTKPTVPYVLGFCLFRGARLSLFTFAGVAEILFRFVVPGTPAYKEMVALRMKVLLNPIGVPRSYINPKQEANDTLIGAYDAGILIGCCILTKVDAGVIQLRQMAVETAFQGRGIGGALLSFAEEVAKDKGCQTLLMHARDPAIPFYEKCGYQVCSEQFFEVGLGHHKMKKTLLPGSNQN